MSEKLSNIRAVLFDLDDTLVATWRNKWEQHKLIAGEYYGIDLTDDVIKLHYGKPVEELVKTLYDTDDYPTALEIIKRHRDDFPKVIFEYSAPALRQIRERGLLTGIVTATSKESIDSDEILNDFVRTHIDYLQTQDDTKHHKPHPEVFKPVEAWLGEREMHLGHVVYVGDSLIDLAAARGAGIPFIGVETGLVSASDFRGHGAISVPNIGGVLELISS